MPPPAEGPRRLGTDAAADRQDRRRVAGAAARRPPASASANGPSAQQPAQARRPPTAAAFSAPASRRSRRRRSRPRVPEDAPVDPTGMGSAAAGLLINGSVNNGAASPFAQARGVRQQPAGPALALHRRRRRAARELGVGCAAVLVRPGSRRREARLQRRAVPRARFGGRCSIPRLCGTGRTSSSAISARRDHNATTQSALRADGARARRRLLAVAAMPRASPVQVHRSDDRAAVRRQRDSARAHQPAGGGAARLLPAAERRWRRPLQLPDADRHRRRGSDSVQTRLTQSLEQPQSAAAARSAISARRPTRRRSSASRTRATDSGLDAQANWSHRISQFLDAARALSVHAAFDDTHAPVLREPHQRVGRGRHRRQQSGAGQLGAADAGVRERRRRPERRALRRDTRTGTHAVGGEVLRFGGRHTITIGGEMPPHQPSTSSRQQDPRGTFTFTGATTRLRLRRLPARPAADQLDRLRQRRQVLPRATPYDAYVNDDWRVSPSFTLNARRALGVRVADHRAPRPAREPRRRAGFHRGRAGPRVDATGTVTGATLPGVARLHRTRAAFSRASASPGGRCRDRRWSFAPATASTATPTSISRSPRCWRSSRRCRRRSASATNRGAPADAGRRLPGGQMLGAGHARTRSPSIRTSASASRRTGRRRCSAICRRR